MSKPKPQSWRDVIKVHPAADLFPLMTPDELKALGEDIQTRGLLSKITLFVPKESNKDFERGLKNKEWAEKLDLFYLLDGRNRLDALECRGGEIVDESGSLNPALTTGCVTFVFENWQHPHTKEHYGIDAFGHVLALNMHRRHLTAEQKREIVAKVVKAQPEKSNRQIAKQIQVDDKTVGNVRRELEGRAEIPHVSAVEDTKGRKQPTHKARRTVDDFIADKNSQEKAHAKAVADRAGESSQQAEHVDEHVQNAGQAVELVESKQSDSDHVLPDADRLVLEILERDKIAPGYAKAVMAGIAGRLEISGYADMPDMVGREPTIAPDALS